MSPKPSKQSEEPPAKKAKEEKKAEEEEEQEEEQNKEEEKKEEEEEEEEEKQSSDVSCVDEKTEEKSAEKAPEVCDLKQKSSGDVSLSVKVTTDVHAAAAHSSFTLCCANMLTVTMLTCWCLAYMFKFLPSYFIMLAC